MPHLSPMSWSFSLLLFTLFALLISILIWWNKFSSLSMNKSEFSSSLNSSKYFSNMWM